MNLAFGSIILFLILLPGVVFRSSYLSSSFSRRIIDRKPIDDIFWAILPAVLFHFAAILLINSIRGGICDVHVDISFLTKWSNTGPAEKSSAISDFPRQIFIYNLVILVLAFILGHFSRWVIRGFRLDRTTNLFRFTNKWYYIFTGELLDFPHIPDDSSDVDLVMLDILSDLSGKSMIYSGQYLDHALTKEGDLENILIKFPLKKVFEKPTDFVEIPSKFFLIPYSTVKNINVRYFSINEASDDQIEEYEKINEKIESELDSQKVEIDSPEQ